MAMFSPSVGRGPCSVRQRETSAPADSTIPGYRMTADVLDVRALHRTVITAHYTEHPAHTPVHEAVAPLAVFHVLRGALLQVAVAVATHLYHALRCQTILQIILHKGCLSPPLSMHTLFWTARSLVMYPHLLHVCNIVVLRVWITKSEEMRKHFQRSA